jgi:hypothetical protein
MKKLNYLLPVLIGIILFSCSSEKKEKNMKDYAKGTFGYDLNYLSQKDDSLVVLSGDGGKSHIIVSGKYQAKVFTSTADGLDGTSMGFVNYKFFDAGKIDEHMNGFGGENRFWLGPEGGRYSVYFVKDSTQVFDNWHTPKPIDIERWDITSVNNLNVSFRKEMEVTNYLGNPLKLQVNRTVALIERSDIECGLSIKLKPNVKAVGYATDNSIVNLNDFEWTKETGTICIWMLDMFNPAPHAITFIPYNEGDEAEIGKIVTSNYFGEIPADRLKVTDSMIFLKTDGKYRSKLGLNAKRTKAIAGNYDPDSKRLTIITFNVDKDATYLSQEWNPKKDPLTGDAMNAYNDGPLDDGSIMGPFLELESVSPAAFLKPKEVLKHKHTVYHFVGEEADLNPITEKLFGISIDEIKSYIIPTP